MYFRLRSYYSTKLSFFSAQLQMQPCSFAITISTDFQNICDKNLFSENVEESSGNL